MSDSSYTEEKSSKQSHSLFRYRGWIPVPLGIALLIWGRPSRESILVGLLIVALGELLRLWSAGHIRSYRHLKVAAGRLVTTGPYAYVRNPLYWGNMLIGTGFAVMANRPLGIAATVLLLLLLYSVVIRGEEEFLTATFGEEYERYRKQVPRLIPRLSGSESSKKQGAFSLRAALRGEIYTLLLQLLLFAFFAAKLALGGGS